MDEQQQEAFNEDDLETQRSIIRQSLDEIVTDIGIAMRDAHSTFPLGITVPSSGAFISMMTTCDPSDEEWEQASAIVRNIVGEKLGGIRLCSNHLPCAMVNSIMDAIEITPNVLESDTRL
jgi:hypothetical protein